MGPLNLTTLLMLLDSTNMAFDYTSTFLCIEALKSGNWVAWKTRVTSLLTLQGLENHLEHDVPPSLTLSSAEDVKKEMDQRKKEMDQWKNDDTKVMALLQLVISDSELYHIAHATSAKQIWTNLADVHEPKGTLAALRARRRLFRMVAIEGRPMSEHYGAFREAMDKLNNTGKEYAISEWESS
ncbi:unnamed protein product [Calypogeia fissa]